MKAIFKYTKTKNSKSLGLEYDGDYSQEEKDEMMMIIIDTFLPRNPLNDFTYFLSRAWDDYKYNLERERRTEQ